MNDASAVADRLAAILPPRWSPDRVAGMVEWHYVLATSSAAEMVEYAKNPKSNPYRVKHDVINGVTHAEFMRCGHHPWLFARKVRDLSVARDDAGLESLTWIEPDSYRLSADGSSVEVARKGKADSIRRRVHGHLSNELIWDRALGELKPQFRAEP